MNTEYTFTPDNSGVSFALSKNDVADENESWDLVQPVFIIFQWDLLIHCDFSLTLSIIIATSLELHNFPIVSRNPSGSNVKTNQE